MIKPTETFERELKKNGGYGRTIRKYSYVVVFCRQGGKDVMAVRMDYYTGKDEVLKVIDEQYHGWNVKCIKRLYEEDFNGRG